MSVETEQSNTESTSKRHPKLNDEFYSFFFIFNPKLSGIKGGVSGEKNSNTTSMFSVSG